MNLLDESTPALAESGPGSVLATALDLTPLASLAAAGALVAFAGARTPRFFSNTQQELQALTSSAGVYDLGWRARYRITGDDRVRWLNGMVTNTVKDLAPGRLNYTFLLNAQGRIQGDADVYALPDALLLATDRVQSASLQAHLDRFIIMDDVELIAESDVTAIGIAGPDAHRRLADAGLSLSLGLGEFTRQDGLIVARERTQQYTVWVAAAEASAVWQRLLAAGAVPCGVNAVESLRILSGIPRYGADIHEKSLAQETGQMRALNFNKGCYLGQEIVERIRSRATMHRGLRAFSLLGEAPPPGTPVFAPNKPDAPVGELTSITIASLPAGVTAFSGIYALGTVRAEAVETPLAYSGGVATALERAPLQTV